MPKKFDREPVVCAVCSRAAHGIGFSPRMGAPIAWTCTDPTCISLGKTVFHMNSRDLDAFEVMALSDAGGAAGEYLESIGKTDLGALESEEWVTFLKTVLNEFGEAMRKRLLNHAAPF
jgi:hypothetical protein